MTDPQNPSNGISPAASKIVYKHLVSLYNKEGKISDKTVLEVIEELYLWSWDDWTHVGACILVCLENKKLVNNYKAGQDKILDTLVGKTMKLAAGRADGEYIKELMPLIIQSYSWD